MYTKIRSILKKNPRKLAIAFFLISASVIAMVYLADDVDAYLDKNDNELIIGFVTDIHAGLEPTKKKGSGIIAPADFEKNLTTALKSMKDEDYVIALGDNIDQRGDCQKYADKLKEITKGYDMLWVKGNHDKDACFPFLSSELQYYIDKNGWRIIVVNNSYWYPKDQRNKGKDNIGFIEQPQIDWLKNALNTDKKVLIAMHIPMFNDNGDGKSFTLRKDYVDFKKMLEEHGNVKYVFSGHYHNDNWHMEENGINYYILPSVSQQGYEGYQMTLRS
jgi:predicted MPP superfamily phosphohydrolase